MGDDLMDEAKRMRETIRQEVLQEVFEELTRCPIVPLFNSSGHRDGMGIRRSDVSAVLTKVNGGKLVVPR